MPARQADAHAFVSRWQRRDWLPAPAWVVSGQAGQLIEQPRGGEDFQEPLRLAAAAAPPG